MTMGVLFAYACFMLVGVLVGRAVEGRSARRRHEGELDRLTRVLGVASPFKTPAVVRAAAPDAEARVMQDVDASLSDAARRGVERLRELYRSAGKSVPSDEALYTEAMEMLHGQSPR